MKKKFIFILSAFCGILTLNSINFMGCDSGTTTQLGEPVSFNRDIQPILAENCSFPGCHNSTDRQAGLDLTSWESTMLTGSTFGAEIIPYNAKWSHMTMHINRFDTNISPFSEPLMPQALMPYTNGMPLASNQLMKIVDWINQGAKNDNGQVAFENITNKAFITNQASDFVAVVNLDNNHLVRLINVGGRDNATQPLDAPHVITVDNQGRYFYVSLIAEGYIEKYDAMTYERVGRMFAGNSPAHIILSNDGTRGWYTNFDATLAQKEMKEFDTQSMTVTRVIDEFRMTKPHGLRLTHNEEYVLMATEGSEFLYLIQASTGQIIDTYPVDPSVPPNGTGTNNFIPYQVSITPDDKYAYITCLKSNDVRVFDIVNRAFILTIPVGLNPLAHEISPDGRWCYVPNRNSNSVSVIDLTTNTVVKTIANVGAQPHKIDFTADGRYAYVTCESVSGGFVHHPPSAGKTPGTTAVIDVLSGHNKIKDIEMASFPAGICITPGLGN
ncbi:MAG: beta-propeller fold lactonase family protein [Ignavibacteria bacterium]|nr:beta-propeller fold lactonase family protein [Ignavibacteria bacterium]